MTGVCASALLGSGPLTAFLGWSAPVHDLIQRGCPQNEAWQHGGMFSRDSARDASSSLGALRRSVASQKRFPGFTGGLRNMDELTDRLYSLAAVIFAALAGMIGAVAAAG